MTKKLLEHQPNLQMKSGKLYAVATYLGGHSNTLAGVEFADGIANSGAPVSAEQVMFLRGKACRIVWWEYDQDMVIEYPSDASGPIAYVEVDEHEPDKEKDTLDLKPKRRRGRPRKEKKQ